MLCLSVRLEKTLKGLFIFFSLSISQLLKRLTLGKGKAGGWTGDLSFPHYSSEITQSFFTLLIYLKMH